MIKEKQIVIDGLLSSYKEAGEGENVLLLHGWGSNAGIFSDIQSELEKKYKVFAVDFPGFAKSDEPKEVWGCEEYANWTEQFIRKTKITDPIVLGHSFGGRIALILNSKMNLRKLILIGSAGLILDTDLKNRKGNNRVGAIKSVLKKILPLTVFEWVKDRAIQQMGSIDYKKSNPHMREVLKKVITEDLKNYAINIQIPTLLIWGENDNDSPVALGRAFNKLIPQSELKIFPGCGHYAFIENKNEFLNLTEEFLKSN